MMNLLRWWLTVGLLLAFGTSGWADRLDDIRARGTLIWGADKSGGGPYVYEDDQGKLVGFEVELADYLAAELGVKAEFRQGQWDKLLALVKRGDIDIVLNGYEWTPDNEAEAASTIPYYIYKLQLLIHKDNQAIQSWDDLKRKPGQPRKKVGVLSSSSSQRFMEKQYPDDVELFTFDGQTNAMKKVEQGQLDATVQDVPISIHYLPEFPKLKEVAEPAAPGYYVIFVRHGEDRLRAQLNQAIAKAIQNGTLERIDRKYGIWNADQTKLSEAANRWLPSETLPRTGSADTDEQRPQARSASLTWSDLERYAWTLTQAAGTTVLLSFASMPLAMLAGLLIALGRLYGPSWLAALLTVYVEFLRGTPLLLQLYVIYYMLPEYGLVFSPLVAGVLGLAINYSAYEAENYRAGLLAIPRGQMEAALSLGMSKWTALRRIVVPQAVRIVIPPVTNDFIALFKDTSVCSVIAVTELTGRYNQLYNDRPKLFLELGLMTALLYLLMSYPLSLVARRLERRFPRVVV